METVYSEDSRQRIQNRIASAAKSKLNGFGLENTDELSLKFTRMMANGNSKEEVLSELEKYSKVGEGKTLEQVERHNKSFVDWLFGYSTVVIPTVKKSSLTHDTPLTEPDTEISNENKLKNTSTPAIDDISEDEGEKKKVNNIPVNIAESILSKQQEKDNDDNIEDSYDASDDDSLDDSDVPELNSDEEQEAAEPGSEETKVETEKEEVKKEEKVEEKKPVVVKRRSFIRIKEGKSGRFTPIKSEDRHAFVKRNLTRVATQLDVASNVQKKMMAHAVAVANASENLTLSKKKSSASIVNNTLEKKKSSFRLDSTSSNASSSSSVYSSTNATFIQSFANKSFPKTSKSSTPTSTSVTPDKSKVVRCSYWPNCNRGEECKFWHPKELCPNLNNCPDGDQCLYIHPAVPQNQLNKLKKKKSEIVEVGETFTAPKHTLQKKISKRESLLSLSSNGSSNIAKKSSKINLKEANGAANSHIIECKFGANCTRPDCKFSHPSPAAILASATLKKKESKIKIKEKISMDILKHKESRSKLLDNEENAQNILCRFDPDCKRANCKFMHTSK